MSFDSKHYGKSKLAQRCEGRTIQEPNS